MTFLMTVQKWTYLQCRYLCKLGCTLPVNNKYTVNQQEFKGCSIASETSYTGKKSKRQSLQSKQLLKDKAMQIPTLSPPSPHNLGLSRKISVKEKQIWCSHCFVLSGFHSLITKVTSNDTYTYIKQMKNLETLGTSIKKQKKSFKKGQNQPQSPYKSYKTFSELYTAIQISQCYIHNSHIV